LPLSTPVCDDSPQTEVLAAGFTVRLRVTDWVCGEVSESATWKVSEALVSAAVGVPLITPVAGANVSPGGSVPLVKDHV
jgi:hypothetical protein